MKRGDLVYIPSEVTLYRYNNNQGAFNVAVGNGSGQANIAGSYNVYLGYEAGWSSTNERNTDLEFLKANIDSSAKECCHTAKLEKTSKPSSLRHNFNT